jgi:alkylhydroperoxidase/carboxymuconolactone decarboxylase family protein YurZ
VSLGQPEKTQPEKTSVAWLARAAIHDPASAEPTLDPSAGDLGEPGLDARTHAMVRLAGLLAAGEREEPWTAAEQHIAAALDTGVTLSEIVGVLVAMLPTAGMARVAAAAQAALKTLGQPAA